MKREKEMGGAAADDSKSVHKIALVIRYAPPIRRVVCYHLFPGSTSTAKATS